MRYLRNFTPVDISQPVGKLVLSYFVLLKATGPFKDTEDFLYQLFRWLQSVDVHPNPLGSLFMPGPHPEILAARVQAGSWWFSSSAAPHHLASF